MKYILKTTIISSLKWKLTVFYKWVVDKRCSQRQRESFSALFFCRIFELEIVVNCSCNWIDAYMHVHWYLWTCIYNCIYSIMFCVWNDGFYRWVVSHSCARAKNKHLFYFFFCFFSGERYTPNHSDQWHEIAEMFSPRSNFATVILDDMIFVIGGYNGKIICPLYRFSTLFRERAWLKYRESFRNFILYLNWLDNLIMFIS